MAEDMKDMAKDMNSHVLCLSSAMDHGRGQEVLVKEALHIQMTPAEERFNRDGELEVPVCWTTVMRRQGGAILTNL